MREKLYICIDRENQSIEFQIGNESYIGQWIEGMPGDGAIYRRENGRVIGGYFPLPFGEVVITTIDPNSEI